METSLASITHVEHVIRRGNIMLSSYFVRYFKNSDYFTSYCTFISTSSNALRCQRPVAMETLLSPITRRQGNATARHDGTSLDWGGAEWTGECLSEWESRPRWEVGSSRVDSSALQLQRRRRIKSRMSEREATASRDVRTPYADAPADVFFKRSK